jgi:hypothetical protein
MTCDVRCSMSFYFPSRDTSRVRSMRCYPVLPSHATRRGKLLVLHIHSLDSNKSGDGVVVFVRAAHKGHLRYCIYQRYFYKDYNYIKIIFSTHINDCKFLFDHELTFNVRQPSIWVGPPYLCYPSLIWVVLMISMHMKNIQN